MVMETSRACASCLQVQERLSQGAADEAYTINCPAGLCDTAVPVRLGDRLVGFLQTGQVFRKTPTRPQFERTLRLLKEWYFTDDPDLARLKLGYRVAYRLAGAFKMVQRAHRIVYYQL